MKRAKFNEITQILRNFCHNCDQTYMQNYKKRKKKIKKTNPKNNNKNKKTIRIKKNTKR